MQISDSGFRGKINVNVNALPRGLVHLHITPPPPPQTTTTIFLFITPLHDIITCSRAGDIIVWGRLYEGRIALSTG